MSTEAPTYSILDEPKPSPISHLAVNPLWPLLAVMFAGPWLAWPWSIVNGFALGSPTRRRETALALGGFVGTAVLLLSISAAANGGLIGETAIKYLVVSLSVWKLGVSYGLYVWQARTFGLWEHFGGVARNGLLVVLLGAFVEIRLLSSLSGFWAIVLQ